ncbi:Eco47II family restriction endonuclease [Corynebacterium amycolatum]|uniref:Eco47II family restriction endonuclease n=1 Tax=Corynebacterium amycolatum TaxID=43765 RepID=UPI002119BC6D|nr:Eco47II family restriction endonuclease [Corynebacterium amycolatum]MCQ9172441.1 Eco47II family restriction endonuclease [Corynebacterium amycolatum]
MTTERYSYGINFFTDTQLKGAIVELMSAARKARERQNIHKNVIDPFSAIFEASSLGVTMNEWRDLERQRQANKSLTNAVGAFHQHLIGCLPGWESTGRSGGLYDLKSSRPFGPMGKPVIAELKNKFNTMNKSGKSAQYEEFEHILRMPEYKGNFTCYLIEVIQKNRTNDQPWVIPNHGYREDIRLVCAADVYADATGQDDAFEKLFKAIKAVLEDEYGFSDGVESETALDLFELAFN